MKKITLLLFIFVLIPLCSQAAVLRSSIDEELLAKSSKAVVSILLDAKGENINALSAELSVISGDAEIYEINDGESIISAWIERPTIENNKVVFAGIIPGGFSGVYDPNSKDPQPGLVMKLAIKSNNSGEVILGIKNLQAYTGAGESAQITADPDIVKILFSNKTDEVPDQTRSDWTVPVFTEFSISKLNNETRGWFVVFNAEDQESGIEYYEIQETFNKEPDPSGWKRAENPYLLKDQHRLHTVFIKAVDRTGNQKIVRIFPTGLSFFEQWDWLIAVILLAAAVSIIVYRRRRII